MTVVQKDLKSHPGSDNSPEHPSRYNPGSHWTTSSPARSPGYLLILAASLIMVGLLLVSMVIMMMIIMPANADRKVQNVGIFQSYSADLQSLPIVILRRLISAQSGIIWTHWCVHPLFWTSFSNTGRRAQRCKEDRAEVENVIERVIGKIEKLSVIGQNQINIYKIGFSMKDKFVKFSTSVSKRRGERQIILSCVLVDPTVTVWKLILSNAEWPFLSWTIMSHCVLHVEICAQCNVLLCVHNIQCALNILKFVCVNNVFHIL